MADVWAVIYYKKHAQWPVILRLSPWIVAGLVVGGGLLQTAERDIFAPVLGGLVLVVLSLELLRLRCGWDAVPHHPAFTAGMGMATGVATMMGNVAGPLANIYLLSRGLNKEHFMGSMAWLFLAINISKAPWFWHLDMITPETLRFNVLMVPAITVGAFLGKALLPRIPQKLFNKLVLALAAAAALKLVFF
jgi:uncharacterized membrane protein YfcA